MNQKPKISIIIPAYNEEKHIAKCLDSIQSATELYQGPVEIIVVLNRCTDSTEAIARGYNLKLIHNQDKNLSKIRNTGAKVATGKIIVTIDADSRMTDKTLIEIADKLESNRYIGGGVKWIIFEKMNLSTIFTRIIFTLVLFKTFYFDGLAVGLFWCYKDDFDAIGGFNENISSAEDIDFARRLKLYGKNKGKKYGKLTKSHLITSNRKFGDWFYVKNIKLLLQVLSNDKKAANKVYYEYPR